MITLSKTLDPADFAELQPELATVDRHFHSASPQHPMRRWEYAMALHALMTLEKTEVPDRLVDVGGAGSPFALMAEARGYIVHLVDPMASYQKERVSKCTLAGYLTCLPRLAQVVTCISVLEHIEDLEEFYYHLSCLVAPGGLLFLTMDYCDGFALAKEDFRVPDTYDLHWMRERIFNNFTLGQLVTQFYRRDFVLLGEVDYAWHGPQVSDYTFASLALVKRA